MRFTFARTWKYVRFALAIIVGIGLCFGLILLILDAEYIIERIEVMQTEQGLPEAQARFNEIIDVLMTATSDELLNERLFAGLNVPGGMFAHCIRGWVERLYSSDRIFEEVLADYAEVADENGWELVNSETDLNTYRNRTPNPSVIVVIIIEPSEHSNHQTTYLVRFRYAEPSVGDCWP